MNQSILILLTVIATSLFACNKVDPRGDAYDNPGAKTPANTNVYIEAEFDGTAWKAEEVVALQNVLSAGGQTAATLSIGGDKGDESIGFTMTSQGRIGEGTYATVPTDSATYAISVLYGSSTFSFSMPLSTANQNNYIKIDKISGNTLQGTFGGIMVGYLTGDTITITNGRFKTDNYGRILKLPG